VTDNAVEPTAVTSAIQLIDEVGVELTGIVHYEHSARLDDSFAGDVPEELSPQTEHTLFRHHEGNQIGVRLRTDLTFEQGQITCDISAQYVAAHEVDLTDQAFADFANNVGIMAILPYTREAVQSLSGRVFGRALLLPVIERGDIAFGVSDDDQDDEA